MRNKHFFAVSSHREGDDIGLYILEPIELNKYSSKMEISIVPKECMGLSYIENYINKVPLSSTYPIAIKSNFINERIMAQRGMFTVHGGSLMVLEKICPKAVKKFVIANEAVPEIKEFLK